MNSKASLFLLFAYVAMIYAYPAAEFVNEEVFPYALQEFVDRNTANPRLVRAVYFVPEDLEESGYLRDSLRPEPRQRRSLQPGGPQLPQQGQDSWRVNPSINRDSKGNTNTNVDIHHTTSNGHEINAGWGKVVDGPGKAKPTWHADATFNW